MASKQEYQIEYKVFPILALSSAISCTLNAPLKLVKIRLQCNQQLYGMGLIDAPYNGLTDLILRIRKYQGFRGYWKGNMAAILSSWLVYIPKMAIKHVDFKIGSSSFFMLAFSLLFTYPLDYARVRLANNNLSGLGSGKFSGITDCLSKTIKNDGIRGVYRGFCVTVAGIFLYRYMYFTVFDTLSQIKSDKMSSLSKALETLFVATFLSHPLDTLKKRMMMSSCEGRYQSSILLCLDILKNQSIKSLYGGYMIHLVSSSLGIISLKIYDSWMHSSKNTQ